MSDFGEVLFDLEWTEEQVQGLNENINNGPFRTFCVNEDPKVSYHYCMISYIET